MSIKIGKQNVKILEFDIGLPHSAGFISENERDRVNPSNGSGQIEQSL